MIASDILKVNMYAVAHFFQCTSKFQNDHGNICVSALLIKPDT